MRSLVLLLVGLAAGLIIAIIATRDTKPLAPSGQNASGGYRMRGVTEPAAGLGPPSTRESQRVPGAACTPYLGSYSSATNRESSILPCVREMEAGDYRLAKKVWALVPAPPPPDDPQQLVGPHSSWEQDAGGVLRTAIKAEFGHSCDEFQSDLPDFGGQPEDRYSNPIAQAAVIACMVEGTAGRYPAEFREVSEQYRASPSGKLSVPLTDKPLTRTQFLDTELALRSVFKARAPRVATGYRMRGNGSDGASDAPTIAPPLDGLNRFDGESSNTSRSQPPKRFGMVDFVLMPGRAVFTLLGQEDEGLSRRVVVLVLSVAGWAAAARFASRAAFRRRMQKS